jgi:hypothetical protein
MLRFVGNPCLVVARTRSCLDRRPPAASAAAEDYHSRSHTSARCSHGGYKAGPMARGCHPDGTLGTIISISAASLDSLKSVQVVAAQAVVWRAVRHPNLVSFFGLYEDVPGFPGVCCISEWMPNGTILTYAQHQSGRTRLSLVRFYLFVFYHFHPTPSSFATSSAASSIFTIWDSCTATSKT